MAQVEKMNYRQWQKRNADHFNRLSKLEQIKSRQQGYCNVSWDKVQKSWKILSKSANNIVSLFEYKSRQNDIVGAIDLSILEAEQTLIIARQAIENIEADQRYLDSLADAALAKYSLL